ncbi:MAG: hypothetical protein ACQESR_05365 [Planctomycetota bacterium]
MRNAIVHGGSMILRTVTSVTGSGSEIVVTAPGWRVRIARWFLAFTVCWLAYQAYAFVMVPWIEPAGPPAMQASPSAGEARQLARQSEADLEGLFASTAWERNNPMELKTRWGRLLFQEYVRIDNGIELHPCTILFRVPTTKKDGTRGKRTIVLKTEDKAVLSFSGELNLVRPQVGKLEGALLDGTVKIDARETFEGANDALSIVTRKVQIRPEQIWTPHDVAFEYGSSRGSGRVLSITLDPNDERAPDDSNASLIRGIETLELVHVDGLHLDFPGEGLFGDAPSQSDDSPRPQSRSHTESPSTTAVDVTCRGPLKFDFQASVATLQEHVDVVHANPSGNDDQLHCDRLRIHFNAREPTAAPKAATGTDISASKSKAKTSDDEQLVPDMAVRRIEATGSEVTLQAPSVKAAARGQRFQYDFHTRRILLEDSQEALFAYREHVVRAPRLKYELREETRRLGKLWARGPGVYQGEMRQLEEPLQVEWKGTLQLKPQDDLHVLSVVEGADITWGPTDRFSADKLFVWLAEVAATDNANDLANRPIPTVVQASHESSTSPDSEAPVLEPPNNMVAREPATDAKDLEVRPVKMLAQGNVQAETEQFQGETTQLEIWFEDPTPTSASDDEAESGQGRSPPNDDAGPARKGEQSPPPETAPAPDSAPSEDSEDTEDTVERFKLSGTQIRLRLTMGDPRPVVREATVSGQVRLTQLPSKKTEPVPLEITGNMLRVQTDRLNRATIDVRGDAARLARVNTRGLMLEGSNLHLSQRQNVMWSEGPGKATLPARPHHDQPDAAETNNSEVFSLSSHSPITINWHHGMDFDGQLIRFMDQVQVAGVHQSQRGEQHHIRSMGEQLHARLNRSVDFSNNAGTDDLDVVELTFFGEVRTENQTFNRRQALTSRDRMKAIDLTLDRRTGDFSARGPGWITSTRVDGNEASNRGGASPTSAAASPSTAAEDSPPLIYLRVDYQNAIHGNLELREAEFMHFVRTVYGPVRSWSQTLDPNRRDGIGPEGIVMTCNTLNIAEMPAGKERSIEMSATGNTIVEGNRFRATAERLTYAEAKEQLIFEGTKRNLATLQQRARVGAEPDEFQARKIIYGIQSGLVDVSGAAKLNYNQLGSPEDIPRARIR